MTNCEVPDAQVLSPSPTPVPQVKEACTEAASGAADGGASPCVFDRGGFLGRLDGAENLLERFLSMFQSSVAAHLAELTQALDRDDTDAIHFRAHSIAGVAASIGAGQIGFLAAQMEERAKAGSLTGLPGLLADLQQAHQLFVTTVAAATADEGHPGR